MKPLRWGDARALYQNRDRDLGMLAELFSTCLQVDLQADDVAQLPAGRADVIERAILEASGLLDDGDDGEGPADPTPDEPADHSVMSGPAAADRAQESLNEHTESDLIYQLHQQGYTFQDAAGLLVPEIDKLMEGIDRANRRKEKEHDDAGSAGDAQGGGMTGNRGGAHGDSLF